MRHIGEIDLLELSMVREAGSAVFASYNIHKCVGSDRRFDPQRVQRVIGEIEADVIALQEADRRFGDRAGLLDLTALAKATGLVPVPVSNTHRGHGWHGNLVLVREGAVRRLRQIALPGLEPRGALVADLDLAMGPVRVVAAHLGLLRHSRLLQVEMLLAHAGDGADRPVVLMGDMNEWRRQGRSALSRFAPGFGPIGRGVPSFPSYFPVLALDRVLVQPEKLVERIEAHDTPLSRLASDHLPVKALIRLDGSLPARPVHPETPVRRRLLSRLLEERPAP
jgi:endonuclease/exonuclease/phosphatase family metal-dependent hydrolase